MDLATLLHYLREWPGKAAPIVIKTPDGVILDPERVELDPETGILTIETVTHDTSYD